MTQLKEVIWIGTALKDLKKFPEAVKDEIGYRLYQLQSRKPPRNVKVLKGFKPAVVEIVANYVTDTYRTIVVVKLSSAIFVLHCFQKKSKFGIKTPKPELILIKQRLNDALEIAKEVNDND